MLNLEESYITWETLNSNNIYSCLLLLGLIGEAIDFKRFSYTGFCLNVIIENI